jgi:hypothetical protein
MTIPEPSTKRVVWVLGAGFSAALGGPMLTGLLSRPSENDLLVRYPEHVALRTDAATVVRVLYESGLNDSSIRGETAMRCVEPMWDNAETFLDYLDTAAEAPENNEPNPHADRLAFMLQRHNWSRASPQDLRNAARRLIAPSAAPFSRVLTRVESSGSRSAHGPGA